MDNEKITAKGHIKEGGAFTSMCLADYPVNLITPTCHDRSRSVNRPECVRLVEMD